VGAAQTLTTLHSFNGLDGEDPEAALVQGTDGNWYGTTSGAGPGGSNGTVFKITPGGTLTELYSFCPNSVCPQGLWPLGLVQATNGYFYGTTAGNADGDYCSPGVGRIFCGTVFVITPSCPDWACGTLTTLYTFCSQVAVGVGPSLVCTDGEIPRAGLVQAADGELYGTTAGGGADNYGTVFKITPSGTLTTLYSFCSQPANDVCTDGAVPEAGLVQAADGNFYGTTEYGGAHSSGTVFRITPSGTLTTLYSFCSQSFCTDGYGPVAGLV
jgi:uncharacterized repeat protein (TIGR03803 family)